ncbi:hypothetical protein ACQ4LE_003518 [Meloidogyne hapla]
MKSCIIIICFILLPFCSNVDAGCCKGKQYCEFYSCGGVCGGCRWSSSGSFKTYKNCKCTPNFMGDNPPVGDIKCDPSTKPKEYNSLC